MASKKFLFVKVVTPKALNNYKEAYISGSFLSLKGANQSNKPGRIVPADEAEAIIAAHNARVKTKVVKSED